MNRTSFFLKANALAIVFAAAGGVFLGLAGWGENPVVYAWIFSTVVTSVLGALASLITSAVLVALKRLNLGLHLGISLGIVALLVIWMTVAQSMR